MNIEEKEALFNDFISAIAFNPSSLYAKKLKKKIMSLDKQEDLKHFIELLNNRINEIKKIEEQKIIEEENNLKNKKKIGSYYYSDEDICFLKEALENGELSIIDLTPEEASLLHVYRAYDKAVEKIYPRINLTRKQDEEFKELRKKINANTISIRVLVDLCAKATNKKAIFTMTSQNHGNIRLEKIKKSKKK